ncbi:MAG TPA: hypothetical protein VLA24_06010, partial [Pseudomonadales bacterium]|nr:hypothetical protein [Pseudomonadales bacterium]
MAGGRGNTTTRNEIPDELKPLITSTANQLISGQFGMPIGQFMWHQPTQVAGLTPWEQHNLKQINRYGLNSGPNPYESEGMTAVRDAADVAYYNQIGLQNEGDARALNRINSMQDVQAQNIGLFNDFDRQGQAVTQQILNLANQNPYSPRTDADMLQALSQANILAGFNPKDLTDLEVESLTNSRDMYRRSGTTFDDLSTYEKEALGQLSRLGAQNQRELASLYEPDVEARRVLGQFTEGELGQSPATQAAMAAYERTIVPQLESRLALRGMANSGAAAEAFA